MVVLTQSFDVTGVSAQVVGGGVCRQGAAGPHPVAVRQAEPRGRGLQCRRRAQARLQRGP